MTTTQSQHTHRTGQLKALTILLITTTLIISSCTFDNEEVFFGNNLGCDTLDMSYTTHIVPIMETACNSCHLPSFPQGSVNTADYDGLSAVAASGSLVGSVWHMPGYSPMPFAQPQLDSCSMKRIAAWVNQGYPDN